MLGTWLTGFDSYAAKNITNEAGKKTQAKVWGEILEVLETAVPEVKDIAHLRS